MNTTKISAKEARELVACSESKFQHILNVIWVAIRKAAIEGKSSLDVSKIPRLDRSHVSFYSRPYAKSKLPYEVLREKLIHALQEQGFEASIQPVERPYTPRSAEMGEIGPCPPEPEEFTLVVKW